MTTSDLEATSRRHALHSMAVATAAFALPLSVVVCAPSWLWLTGAGRLEFIPIAVLVSLLLVIFLPLARIGGGPVRRMQKQTAAQGRARNVAEEIGIAIGRPPESVLVHPSPIPNVGAFPTRRGTVVIITQGATDLLQRDELEALVAAQLAGAEDAWCRRATRAELVWALAVYTMALACFITPVAIPLSIIAVFTARKIESTRDLCADVAAVRATRHPEALARAMRRLRVASPVASEFDLGLLRNLTAPFLALSNRRKSSTSIGGDGHPKSRSWNSADEIALELALRADRAEALAGGADPAEYTGREYVQRWKSLGLEHRLSDDEQLQADELAGRVGGAS